MEALGWVIQAGWESWDSPCAVIPDGLSFRRALSVSGEGEDFVTAPHPPPPSEPPVPSCTGFPPWGSHVDSSLLTSLHSPSVPLWRATEDGGSSRDTQDGQLLTLGGATQGKCVRLAFLSSRWGSEKQQASWSRPEPDGLLFFS